MSHLNANITLYMCVGNHVYSIFRSRDTQYTLYSGLAIHNTLYIPVSRYTIHSIFRSHDTQYTLYSGLAIHNTLEMVYQNLRRYSSANVYGTANWYNVRLL